MKELILKYPIKYGQLLNFFKAKILSRANNKVTYTINIKDSNYTIFFYKEDGLKAYCLETFNEYSVFELLYFFSPENSGEYISSIIPKIFSIPSFDEFLDLIEDSNTTTIKNSSLNLKEYNEELKFDDSLLEVLNRKPFENRILLKENKLCFPLSYERKINNLAYLNGEELNSNYGFFSSTLIQGKNKAIALFFQPSTLINHANTHNPEEYFYILFSNNFNHYLVSKLKHFSYEVNLPIEIFINYSLKEADKIFQYAHLILTIYSTTFESISFEFNESKYTLHFYSKNNSENLYPLIDFVNKINRRLIIYYNQELSISTDDIASYLNLITTEAKKENEYARNSISFFANNNALCAVLNEVFKLLSIDNITFKNL